MNRKDLQRTLKFTLLRKVGSEKVMKKENPTAAEGGREEIDRSIKERAEVFRLDDTITKVFHTIFRISGLREKSPSHLWERVSKLWEKYLKGAWEEWNTFRFDLVREALSPGDILKNETLLQKTKEVVEKLASTVKELEDIHKELLTTVGGRKPFEEEGKKRLEEVIANGEETLRSVLEGLDEIHRQLTNEKDIKFMESVEGSIAHLYYFDIEVLKDISERLPNNVDRDELRETINSIKEGFSYALKQLKNALEILSDPENRKKVETYIGLLEKIRSSILKVLEEISPVLYPSQDSILLQNIINSAREGLLSVVESLRRALESLSDEEIKNRAEAHINSMENSITASQEVLKKIREELLRILRSLYRS